MVYTSKVVQIPFIVDEHMPGIDVRITYSQTAGKQG
jgi:hypothetical protein